MARHWSRVHLRLRTTHDRGSGRGAQCPECPAKTVATLSLLLDPFSTAAVQGRWYCPQALPTKGAVVIASKCSMSRRHEFQDEVDSRG